MLSTIAVCRVTCERAAELGERAAQAWWRGRQPGVARELAARPPRASKAPWIARERELLRRSDFRVVLKKTKSGISNAVGIIGGLDGQRNPSKI